MVGRFGIGTRTLGIVFALILAFAVSVPARADVVVGGITVVDSDLPFVSSNIDVLGNIPVVGAIGANFRGNFMYVTGVEGLSTFDISNPALPLPTDFDALPHFENEDVSIGGNLLLIANDSAEGVGVLYVFDISNPASPTLKSVFPTGGTIISGTPSHTVTCIKGCRYAYLAGNDQGIGIVDLRNPAAPKLVGSFKPPITGFATHDINVDSKGYAWIVGGQGTAAYYISNPLRPVLIGKTDVSGTTGPLNDFIHHNSKRPDVVRSDGSRSPGSTLLITEEDYARPTCEGAGSFQTWRVNSLSVTTPGTFTNLDSWATELDELTKLQGQSPATILCSAHWFDERKGIVAQGWYEQGTRILDVRNPRDIKQVGFFVMPDAETWDAKWAPTDPKGEILYTIDLARGVDILRVRPTPANARSIKAPVRQSWLATGAVVPAPSSPFSTAHPTFQWACRIPTVTQ